MHAKRSNRDGKGIQWNDPKSIFDHAVALVVSLAPLLIPFVIYHFTYMFSSSEVLVATPIGFFINIVWLLVYPAWWLTRKTSFSLLLWLISLVSSLLSFWLLSDPWQSIGANLGAP